MKKYLLPFMLLVAVCIQKIYFLLDFPFLVDEVYSFIHFIDPGPFYALTDYREPNNHIFFSLISSFLKDAGIEGIYAMRAISFLFFIILLIVLYSFIEKHFGKIAAILSLAFNGLYLPSGDFGILGRGYMMMYLFANLSILFCFLYFNYTKRKNYILLFTVFNTFGFITIPVYAFVVVGLIFYIMYKCVKERDFHDLKYFFLSFLISALVAILFYMPAIYFTGIESLINNKWVKAILFGELMKILPVAIMESISFLTGIPEKVYIFVLPVLFLIVYVYKGKNTTLIYKEWIVLVIFMLASPLVLVLLKEKFPPYRTLGYLAFPLFVTFSIALSMMLKNIKNNFVNYSTITLLIVSTLIIGTYRLYESSRHTLVYGVPRSFYDKLFEITERIVQNKPQAIYVNKKDEYLAIYLRYKTNNSNMIIDEVRMRDRKYDYVILYDKKMSENVDNYSKAFSLDDANVYKLKEGSSSNKRQ